MPSASKQEYKALIKAEDEIDDDNSPQQQQHVGGMGGEDDFLPVALATHVLPMEIEKGGETEIESKSVRVRVVAPCRLSPNYLLTVQVLSRTGDDEGEYFEVVVPRPGVHEGEEFEADKVVKKPIRGRWSSDLCDCGSEGDMFFLAWCCSGIAYASLMETLRMNWMARPSQAGKLPKATFRIVSGIWILFLVVYLYRIATNDEDSVLILIFMLMFIYLICVYTKTRMAVRARYQIPGDCFTDCCISYCCSCCSALQIFRHLKRSGEYNHRANMCGGVGVANAEIV